VTASAFAEEVVAEGLVKEGVVKVGSQIARGLLWFNV
jgi:hypothetical protein